MDAGLQQLLDADLSHCFYSLVYGERLPACVTLATRLAPGRARIPRAGVDDWIALSVRAAVQGRGSTHNVGIVDVSRRTPRSALSRELERPLELCGKRGVHVDLGVRHRMAEAKPRGVQELALEPIAGCSPVLAIR